jgi:hypothetical protein
MRTSSRNKELPSRMSLWKGPCLNAWGNLYVPWYTMSLTRSDQRTSCG